jgi:putative resolvase
VFATNHINSRNLWKIIEKLWYHELMKLTDYAKKLGVTYRTAWNWYKSGKIDGYQTDTGTIIITEGAEQRSGRTAVYARVSSNSQRGDIEKQTQRICEYCYANGWKVDIVVKEIASGLNDTRPKLEKLLSDNTVTRIVIENRDRLTRFGFNYIQVLMNAQGRTIEVMNLSDDDKTSLIEDLVSIVYSFSARLYGKRKAKHKANCVSKIMESADDVTC